jgi:small subunit ribosomal protein S20
MANKKASIKQIKVDAKRRARNRARRSAVKTAIKKAILAIQEDPANAFPMVKAAISALDRAASKNAIHKRNAARRKSRLMQKYNKAVASLNESQS